MSNFDVETVLLNTHFFKEFGLPKYATKGSAGLDLRACIQEPIILEPGKKETIPTGIAFHIKDPGVAGFLMNRSGVSHKNLVTLTNQVGLIDSDYQGEIGVKLINNGHKNYVITRGMRIAQYVFLPILRPDLKVVYEFSSETERGDGGFGSTGE